MINHYLPFLIGLIIYSGIIIMNLCTYIQNKHSKSRTKKGNKIIVQNMITSIMIVLIIYLLCRYNHENIAWIVVATPFILSLILFMILLYNIKTFVIQCKDNKI